MNFFMKHFFHLSLSSPLDDAFSSFRRLQMLLVNQLDDDDDEKMIRQKNDEFVMKIDSGASNAAIVLCF